MNARYSKNTLDITVIIASFLSLIIAFTRIGFNGYGNNINNYSMLRSWQEMLANGIYVPSRFQGNLPSELILGSLAAIWGPVGSNSFSFILSILSLVLAYRLFRKIESDQIKIGLALATVAVNPFWVEASTTSMDYIHPIPFFLAGILLVQNRIPIIAAIFFAVAGGMRISYAPLGFGTLLFALYMDSDKQQRDIILQSLLVYIIFVSVIYLPVFISAHLQLSFLSSARPVWQGILGLIARFAYKTIYLYGVIGTIIVFISFVLPLRRQKVADYKSVRADKLIFYKVCVGFIIFHLLLFLYIPVRIEYLIPVLLAFAGIFIARDVHNAVLLALVIAEVSYWFVSIDLLEVRHMNADPCAAVVAVEASFKPHLGQGVLVDELTGKTSELLCLPKLLLEQPVDIRDRLPVPARR